MFFSNSALLARRFVAASCCGGAHGARKGALSSSSSSSSSSSWSEEERQRGFREAPPALPETEDPFLILNVKIDATEAEIKTSFYQLAKRVHPDAAPRRTDALKAAADFHKLVSNRSKHGRLCLTMLFGQITNIVLCTFRNPHRFTPTRLSPTRPSAPSTF